MSENKKVSNLRPKEELKMASLTLTLGDLCLSHKMHLTPAYQRSDVWSTEDRIKLMDSVFGGIDLGSIALAELPYKQYKELGCDYEVVDGKQRLTTLISYFSDEFSYEGYKYSELSVEDQRYMKRRLLRIGMIQEDDATEENKITLFLKLNKAGVPQSQEHLKHVEEMLQGIKK